MKRNLGLSWVVMAFATATATAGEAPQTDDLSWVWERVQKWQPQPGDRKFDEIGWGTEVRAGLALAKKHNRPFFLFRHDGRIARGRC